MHLYKITYSSNLSFYCVVEKNNLSGVEAALALYKEHCEDYLRRKNDESWRELDERKFQSVLHVEYLLPISAVQGAQGFSKEDIYGKAFSSLEEEARKGCEKARRHIAWIKSYGRRYEVQLLLEGEPSEWTGGPPSEL